MATGTKYFCTYLSTCDPRTAEYEFEDD